MILYTTLPQELILEGIENEPEFMEIEYQGVKLEVRPISLNRFAINRIISSDPAVFLEPGLAPGTILSLPFREEEQS